MVKEKQKKEQNYIKTIGVQKTKQNTSHKKSKKQTNKQANKINHYPGILEADTTKQREMKEKVRKDYLNRSRKLLEAILRQQS